MGNEISNNYKPVFPEAPRSSGKPSPKAQQSTPQAAPPPYLERLPDETEDRYQAQREDIDHVVANSSFFAGKINAKDYQTLGRLLTETKWDSIPSKKWSMFKCRLWIRAYLMQMLNQHQVEATKAADRFTENGQWLVHMNLEDWIKICPVGGRSIWRLLEGHKAEGRIS